MRQGPRMGLTGLACLTLVAITALAIASPDYSGCESCHGAFNGGSYESLHDGATWANSLMNAHADWVDGNCLACHMAPGPGAVRTNASGDATFSKGCVGCHGREEDITDVCTGESSSSFFEVQCGAGAGLRRVHEQSIGIGTCTSCHSDDPEPVGEQVAPHNFLLAASRVRNACNDDGTEARFGPTGLDNDGDGRRDADA